jgi:hypothetical protein
MTVRVILHDHDIRRCRTGQHRRDRHDANRSAGRNFLVPTDDDARARLRVHTVGIKEIVNDHDIAITPHSRDSIDQ